MLAFITIIKRSGPDRNGDIFDKNNLKKLADLGNQMDFIPGTIGYDKTRRADPSIISIEHIKFSIRDLIYDDKNGGRVRAHIKILDPSFEKFVFDQIRNKTMVFSPCIIGKYTKDKPIEIYRLISVDLIPVEREE